MRIRVISFRRVHFFLIFYNGFYRNKRRHTPSMACGKSVRLKLKLCHSPLMCASGLTVDFPFKGENENNLDAPHAFVKSERIQHCRSPPPEEIPFHLLSSLLLLLPPPPPPSPPPPPASVRVSFRRPRDLKALYECNGACTERGVLLAVIAHHVVG